MAYHFWDMDHTLVDCDCEVSWKRFLVDEGLADPGDRELADKFFLDYAGGFLDSEAYLQFQMKDFQGKTVSEIATLSKRHFETRVILHIHEGALSMVREQVREKEQVFILTATGRAIALPVAEYFGIPRVIATEFELEQDRYTGRIVGTYCLGSGKLTRLERFCEAEGISLDQVHYYGDSLPDVHVLQQVGFPVAVNPMPGLLEVAMREGWEILDFRP